MSQVLLYLPFGNPEQASQLIAGHPLVGQKIDDALAERAFRRQHACMVRTELRKIQMTVSESSPKHVSLACLKVAPTPSICHNPFPHLLSHHD